ncbi:MAG TPA: hypothetical protein VF037_11405 [Gemmatimonadales bacterium]
MRKLVGAAGAVLALALVAGNAAAQETGTPVFKSPYRSFATNEYGLTFSDPGSADWALEGFYGYGRDRWDLGLRAGLMDRADETGILVGGSARTRVLQSSESFPLDGALTLGVGAQFSDDFTLVMIPIGVSLGRRVLLEGSETSFVPYLHPVIVPTLGDNGDDEVQMALGLGVDIKFSRSFDIRVAGAIGDDLYEGVSIGLAIIR